MPPVAVVAWIYVLGRRDGAAPGDEAQDEEAGDDEPAAPAGEPGLGRGRRG